MMNQNTIILCGIQNVLKLFMVRMEYACGTKYMILFATPKPLI